MQYLDFDVVIETAPSGLRSRVLHSPFDAPSCDFTVPFDDDALTVLIQQVGAVRGERRLVPEPREPVDVRRFGASLHDAVLGGAVGSTWQRSLDEARRRGAGLRLRLRFEPDTGMQEVPWELLYSAGLGRFLAMSASTPVVRFVDQPQPTAAFPLGEPLRVLVAAAQPPGTTALEAADEVSRLDEATALLRERGALDLEVSEHTTFGRLRRRLARARDDGYPFHVLHYIGHGGFEPGTGAGALLLEDDGSGRRAVTGHDLAMLLHEHPSLRLTVLNTCEGGRASRADPFGGVAQSLVRQGIPAVVAMQFEISDGAARVFAEEFYTALAYGKPVDEATSEGRLALFTSVHNAEWATPVLYLLARDGRLFERIAPAARAAPRPAVATPDPVGHGTAGSAFSAGTPVSDPARFFGRYVQTRRLLATLRRPPLQNLAVVGPRRSGKTSLLRHLAQLTAAEDVRLRPAQRALPRDGFARHRWVHVDFQHPACATRDGLMRRVLQQIGGAPAGPLTLPEFYDLVSERLTQPTVILLDELGVALQRYRDEFDDGFWDALRSLASSPAGQLLGFVLSTHEPPAAVAASNHYASSFFNIFGYTATMGPLTEAEATELLDSSPVPFAADDAAWILATSHCWPVVLQVLSRELLAAMQDGQTAGWRGQALEQARPFLVALQP